MAIAAPIGKSLTHRMYNPAATAIGSDAKVDGERISGLTCLVYNVTKLSKRMRAKQACFYLFGLIHVASVLRSAFLAAFVVADARTVYIIKHHQFNN